MAAPHAANGRHVPEGGKRAHRRHVPFRLWDRLAEWKHGEVDQVVAWRLEEKEKIYASLSDMHDKAMQEEATRRRTIEKLNDRVTRERDEQNRLIRRLQEDLQTSKEEEERQREAAQSLREKYQAVAAEKERLSKEVAELRERLMHTPDEAHMDAYTREVCAPYVRKLRSLGNELNILKGRVSALEEDKRLLLHSIEAVRGETMYKLRRGSSQGENLTMKRTRDCPADDERPQWSVPVRRGRVFVFSRHEKS